MKGRLNSITARTPETRNSPTLKFRFGELGAVKYSWVDSRPAGRRGTLGRPLSRPERSAAEIAALPDPASGDLSAYVEKYGADLAPETLVYLLRRLSAPGHEGLRERVARLLVGVPDGKGTFKGGHCEAIIRADARWFGFGDDLESRCEFRAACHQKMWEAIAAGTNAKPFWEERFYSAAKDAAIDVGRAMRRVRETETTLAEVGCDPEEPGIVPDDNDLETKLFDRLTDERLSRAIRKLPRGPRLAVWLRWKKGFQVESNDPNEQTVATVLKISGSMVRRHLRTAKALLRQDPDIRDLLGAGAA